MFEKNAELETDRRILYQYITSRLNNGQTEFTYSELSKAIARDITKKRELLSTVRREIQKELHVLFKSDYKVGISCVSNFSTYMDVAIGRVYRAAGRAASNVIQCIKDQSDEEKISINARLSCLGVVRLFTKPSSMKKIESKVREMSGKELPTAETLRLFEK